jgi:hypothetical protein
MTQTPKRTQILDQRRKLKKTFKIYSQSLTQKKKTKILKFLGGLN